ncbi:MAG: hypothetical protein Q7S96_01970 [bacterium]|nr:hypothetical protein [bacterium]
MDIIGHGETLAHLERLTVRDELAHAYLLVGPAHAGKASIARWLAQRLLCTTGAHTPAPCGTCGACGQVERDIHADVRSLRPVEGVIPVGDAREWTGALSGSSLFAGWKIGIIEGAELLNGAAANALLKTIEEPTPRTVIVLTTTSVRGVLPTVASRCAILRVGRTADEVIDRALRERGVSATDAAVMVALAEGCPGRALSFLSDHAALADAREREDMLTALCSGTVTERLHCVERICRGLPKDRTQSRRIVAEYIAAFARAAQARIRTDVVHVNRYAPWLHAIAHAPRLQDANTAPRLILESLTLALPSV